MSRSLRYLNLVLLVFLVQFNSGTVRAEEEPQFVRVQRSDTGVPLSLDTAVVRYKSTGTPFVVDFYPAVHVGDKSYYQALNKAFQDYDAVLYELIAEKGQAIPEKKDIGNNPVSALQLLITDTLKLSFQLEEIDYQAKNFVHADLTPGEFMQSMKDRNESFFKLFMRVFFSDLANSERPDNPMQQFAMLFAFMHGDRALLMKRLLAGELADMETFIELLSGPDGSTIITARNTAALNVLDAVLEQGKRKIAVFYGAGHMPDLLKQLRKRHRVQYESSSWITAWDMS